MNAAEERRLKETVETLDGSRNIGVRRRRAVRIEDIAPLLEIPDLLQATPAAGAAPTKAEYDALLRDVDTIRLRIFQVQQNLQKKLV